MKKIMGCILMMAALLLCCRSACAQEAQDMTQECKIVVSNYSKDKQKMFDNANLTMWESANWGGYINVKAPEGKKASGVYIRWGSEFPPDVVIQVPGQAKDEWITVMECTGDRHNQYIAFPEPLAHFRVQTAKKNVIMGVIKFQVLSEGERPEWAQVWEPFEGKADLMVIVAHPDDELLFMGGVIPYYNTVEGKKVIVVYVARAGGFRKVELLDGLWRCGMRTYPEVPSKKFRDIGFNGRNECLKTWGEEKLMDHVTEMIRKYQPDVIVTHDVNGEYGHGAHKAVSYSIQKCVEFAANEKKYKESAELYGTWQTKKAYIHLYKGELGQIDFDWRQPMDVFDGKTIHEVTTEAFALHKTQASSGRYKVEDFGKYDNSLFGLFYSTVGPDTGMNDLFENIE